MPHLTRRYAVIFFLAADDFWRPALGDHYWIPIIIVWVLGFIVAELINKRMRRQDHALSAFRANVWPSFPICFGSPLLGAAGARFIMVWTEAQSPWWFGAVAISINAIAAALGTIVNIYLNDLRIGGKSVVGKRKRQQELSLFLHIGTPVRDDEASFYTTRQIELALEYSGAGRVEGYRREGEFFIIEMAGPSAERLFGTLRVLLAGTSTAPGSFAVIRREDASQEIMIEL